MGNAACYNLWAVPRKELCFPVLRVAIRGWQAFRYLEQQVWLVISLVPLVILIVLVLGSGVL